MCERKIGVARKIEDVDYEDSGVGLKTGVVPAGQKPARWVSSPAGVGPMRCGASNAYFEWVLHPPPARLQGT
jgi:hypothetical protein